MYKRGKQVEEFLNIAETLNACDTLHLAINDEGFPYIIPLSFGFDLIDGDFDLYFYINRDSRSHELIETNHQVSIETEILYNYFDVPRVAVSCAYGSVVAHGKPEIVPEKEIDFGMDLILTHCGYEGFPYDPSILDDMIMYKMKLEDVSCRTNINTPQ